MSAWMLVELLPFFALVGTAYVGLMAVGLPSEVKRVHFTIQQAFRDPPEGLK